MKPSLQKLQKFFKLEAERNFDNKSVVGGLDRMLERWEAEARAERVSEDSIQAVVSRVRDYPRLSPTSRAEVLEGLWRRIQRNEGLAAAAASAPAAPASAAAGTSAPAAAPAAAPPSARRSPAAPRHPEKKAPTPRPLEARPLPVEEAAEPNPEEVAPPLDEPAPIEERAPAPVRRQPPENVPAVEPAALAAPVTVLPGIGQKHAQVLARLGLNTLRDMLYYLPRRYDDYSRLKPINQLWFGEEVTVIGTVQNVTNRVIRSGHFQITEAVVSDGSGALRVNWFNQAWIGKRLRPGVHISLSGKIEQYLGRLVMNNPDWEPLEQQQLSTNRIVPVYPLTAKITQRWLRKMLRGVIDYWAPRLPDMLPPELRRSAGVVPLMQALFQVHFPDSWEELKSARYRLAFDEIFLLQLGVLRQKRAWQERSAQAFVASDDWLAGQIQRLPYALTGAQQRTLQDIRQDLLSGRPMNRLLQGDVGSGKTVVAALGISLVVQGGAQAALMAPTSILAEQHYRSLLNTLAGAGVQPLAPDEKMVEPTLAAGSTSPQDQPASPQEPPASPQEPPASPQEPPASPQELPASPQEPPAAPALTAEQIRLLVGATPESEKREIRAGLAAGTIKLVIGTHALIEDPVQFQNLGLVIIDEQHRFGVAQRQALRAKGDNPHLLVMTATPIPRSLALTVYGDLDLSVMDEMPPGRQPVSTFVVTPRERERVYSLVRSQVEKGRQIFIIYPLIEENENSEAKAAVAEHARLQREIFPHLKLGLLHGRMRPDEKDEVMARFRDRELDILVSTSVVEVGVDIPNATVMLIEGANRFGLAQLHQFRGRVGRGSEQSFCILVPDSNETAENERLQVMSETNDGFVLAERDLQQRGPGQFLGTRQAGFSELQMANLVDVRLIENARRQAQLLFENNPEFDGTEFAALKAALERFWDAHQRGDIS